MKRVAIVVRDDGYDKMLTPLTFAYVFAREGAEVDILFVLWAVRALTPSGVDSLKIEGRHAADEDWLRAKLARGRRPGGDVRLHQDAQGDGRVHFYGCRLAASTFDVTRTT